jgi:hypothetical protein
MILHRKSYEKKSCHLVIHWLHPLLPYACHVIHSPASVGRVIGDAVEQNLLLPTCTRNGKGFRAKVCRVVQNGVRGCVCLPKMQVRDEDNGPWSQEWNRAPVFLCMHALKLAGNE